MAHIDAGKTTTSERMLYYSGFIPRVGEVHHGDTVLDYMMQERERGITITSAAVTFNWGEHQVNLVDTPGHVDFTMEVERSMSVLDGGILVLDGSRGVEAQTVTVWRQAVKYSVPRIAYINKLDRSTSSVSGTLDSIRNRLRVEPLLTQMALGGEGSSFCGVLDLVTMSGARWRLKDGAWGRDFQRIGEEEMKTSMFHVWKEAKVKRAELVEMVADLDLELADLVIDTEDFEGVGPEELMAALRRVALDPDSSGLVTLLGSSYTNVGVQPLMDAIVSYCPSPLDRTNPASHKFGDNFCGLVFKILHHPTLKDLAYVRTYSGKLHSKDNVYNVNQRRTEKFTKLMVAFADDYREVSEVGAGNIVVLSGLKNVITGDTIVLNKSLAKAVEARSASSEDSKEALEEDEDEDDSVSSAALVGPSVPDPVVFCVVESPSLTQQKQFEFGLSCLAREDPSIRLVDKENGQWEVGGMGELHLEIIRDKMSRSYKVEMEMGQLQVAYKEIPSLSLRKSLTFSRTLGGREHSLSLDLELKTSAGTGHPTVAISQSRESQDAFAKLWKRDKVLRVVQRGLREGLESGPLLELPVMDCQIILHNVTIGRGTKDTMVAAGCNQLVRGLLGEAGVQLAEPVMKLEIVTGEDKVGLVMEDMGLRRGEVGGCSASSGDMLTVSGLVPMAELRGYSSRLRQVTSGDVIISMELSHYQTLGPYEQDRAIQDITGFSQ